MPLSKDQIQEKINEVLKTGMWMIRRSNNGRSCYNGFQWALIGEWTVAPDWNPSKKCGGGLHGNGPLSKGYWADGRDIDFCAVENIVDIDEVKIKCEKAMVLLRNELPYIKSFAGDFDVSGCDLSGVKLPESVGGSLDASGCDLSGVKFPESIGWSLDVRGCDLSGVKLPESLGGYLYASGCDLSGVKLQNNIHIIQ